MMAAVVVGKEVLPPPATFDMKIMMVAMMIRLPLSIVYGLIGAWLVHRYDWTGTLLIGAVLGLAIYIINFYVIAPVLFPWFVMARNSIGAFAHVMFGVVIGAVYVGLRKPRAVRR